jgi:large subunit ribosomal protein L17
LSVRRPFYGSDVRIGTVIVQFVIQFNTAVSHRIQHLFGGYIRPKELRPYVEKLITLAKHGGLSNRRLAQSRLMDDAQLAKLFDVLAPRYAKRDGGYTRVIKAGIRQSDAAPIAVIEFVDRDASAKGQDSGPVMNEDEFEAA